MSYIQPVLPVLLTLGLAAMLACRRWRSARWAAISVWLCLALACWPPADWLFSRHLEAAYPVRPFRQAQPAGAVVVLSSAVSPPQWERPYALPDHETLTRCERAAWLYRHWAGAAPVLTSGGASRQGEKSCAETMKVWLERAGVPSARIWTETASRSTHENAEFSARILRARGIGSIALVVDSQSMRRAEACFRKLGFEVTPVPSSFRYLGSWREEILPHWQAVQRNETALHETLGWWWYWWRGWI
ncbi:MAG: YdcF family protein [Bryobacterales bacterium]|nr:YdcF family protein [Bryobacterales bacterium]